MKPHTRFARTPIAAALLAAWFGLGSTAALAGPLAIAETPLLVSTTVEPNVMLLMDDSGSMNHIMWHDEYDPNTAYAGTLSTNTTYYTSSAGWYTFNGRTYQLPHPAGSDGYATRWSGNYLNWISTYFASGTDLTGGLIPNSTRMQTARDAATDFVSQTPGMRFGLTSFNNNDGGRVRAVCGSATSTITTAIDALRATTWTPLAETLYEITRYFRGMNSYYGSTIPGGGSTYSSPIQYRCQKNFAIVITDGLPTYDTNFPTDDPDDVLDTSAALPDWDDEAPATPITVPQVYPQYSDGHATGSEWDEGYSLYLDDIAKFAYDIDMKTTGTDGAGGSYQDANFLTQNLHTYTIGFTVDNQMLEDAAEYGNGLYLTANTSTQLTEALQGAISHVFSTSSSASSVAANSTRLNTDTKIYQARFNSAAWSGELLAYPINSDGTVGTSASNAANNMPAHGDRTIYAYNPSSTPKGVPFTWSGGSTQLSAAQQTYLNTNPDTSSADGQGPQRVAYLRGDQSLEQQNGGTFRNRSSILGDIVNSDPHFVGTPDYRYHLLTGTEGEAYETFRASSSYKNRTPMLYVGGNDGMLHAFNASTLVERFAFVPNAVFSKLSALTSPDYSHTFFVDGSPRSGDAYIGGSWKTVLVSGLRAGGKAIFALDITNPAGFSGDNVLWEFTDTTNLGYTFSQPTIVRLGNGQWAAVFGNGYNSTAQTAQLFIVNLADGTLIRRIDTGVGSATAAGVPNGLSTPAPVDVDGDRITDYVYAGDLYGNMWKFDLTANNVSNWNVAYRQGGNNYPLFKAVDGSGNGQPITARPEIGSHPASGTAGGLMVYFGTGKYFETGDNTVPASAPVQSFYGIRDNGSRVTSRSDLQQQTITTQTVDGRRLRTVSEYEVAATERGWYMNLPENGERSVSNPVLRSGRIIFTTLIPSPDPCAFGGRSWFMEVDAVTGANLSYPVFDLNGDGVINEDDCLADGTCPAGEEKDGILPTPEIVGAGELEYKYMSSSSGTVEVITELGDSQSARQSWRQIR